MASIIKANLNLAAIPKDKIYKGKKGSYLPITITINDELGNYGDNGPIIVEQTKEERDAKVDKVYLGNVKVVWTNGNNVDTAPKGEAPAGPPPPPPAPVDDDLPF